MNKKGQYKLTSEGSLGVLALGDVGIKLWREQRKKEGKDPYQRKNQENTDQDGEKARK